MSTEWIEFNDDHHYSDKLNPRASLDSRRVLRLNGKALEMLGRPKSIRLLFDAAQNRIGIRPEEAEKPYAFRVNPNSTGTTSLVRAFPFCKRFGIKPEFTIAFQGIRRDPDGTLILDLSTAKRKGGRAN